MTFSIEEESLLSIYCGENKGSRKEFVRNLAEAYPYIDDEMRSLARRTIDKINSLSEEEWESLTIYPYSAEEALFA